MLIEEGVTTNFGLWLGLGATVVPAWILEVATSNAYSSDLIYFDQNRMIMEPARLGQCLWVSQ